MRCVFLGRKGEWSDVKKLALSTVGKDCNDEPKKGWIYKICKAEHSPIRAINYTFQWICIPYWVSVHLSRHKFGVEHYVQSQREDKGKHIPRHQLYQSQVIDHTITVNPQALINISRKRMCMKASPETRSAWMMLVQLLDEIDPELAKCCLPDCLYRGKCYEMKPCGKKGWFYSKVQYLFPEEDACGWGGNIMVKGE